MTFRRKRKRKMAQAPEEGQAWYGAFKPATVMYTMYNVYRFILFITFTITFITEPLHVPVPAD